MRLGAKSRLLTIHLLALLLSPLLEQSLFDSLFGVHCFQKLIFQQFRKKSGRKVSMFLMTKAVYRFFIVNASIEYGHLMVYI